MTQMDPLPGYQPNAADRAARAEQAKARVAQVHPAVSSDDGAVTITVSAAGALAGIQFGPAAQSLEPDDLAALVMRTAQLAREQAARQTQQALAPLVGESGPAMDFLRARLPSPEATEPDEEPEDGFAGRGI